MREGAAQSGAVTYRVTAVWRLRSARESRAPIVIAPGRLATRCGRALVAWRPLPAGAVAAETTGHGPRAGGCRQVHTALADAWATLGGIHGNDRSENS